MFIFTLAAFFIESCFVFTSSSVGVKFITGLVMFLMTGGCNLPVSFEYHLLLVWYKGRLFLTAFLLMTIGFLFLISVAAVVLLFEAVCE